MRRRVKKDLEQALPGQQPLFVGERLRDMPLAKGRVAKAALAFTERAAFLTLTNLEEPLTWQLALVRTAKAEPVQIASSFSVVGSRFVRPFHDVPAQPTAKAPDASAPAIGGNAEFGLQDDGDHEYFLSKFGDLVGVVRIKRKEDGGWSATMAKTLTPRVLTKEAVDAGLMPPLGHSALPKSLESVVPAEHAYWKAADIDSARAMRDALVESGFLGDDCIKAVDGEMRKVEVRYFLYEPPTDVMPSAKAIEKILKHKKDGWHVFSEDGSKHLGGPYESKAQAVERLRQVEGHKKSFGERIVKAIPERFIGKVHTPMAEEDWLEALDKSDAPDALAILSPPDRGVPAREMVRAAASLKGDFILEHEDTRANRFEFARAGVVFKLDGERGRVLCASFAPVLENVILLKDAVVKTVTFQGIPIKVDRPAGYVQKGTDEGGNEWQRTYQTDYGFIPRTTGGDGEDLDVFIGPDDTSKRVFWVTQKKADGSFDEFKVFVGFSTPADARACYAAHIPTRFYDGMQETSIDVLKSLLGLPLGDVAKRLAKLAGVSYEQLRAAVNAALSDAYPQDKDSPCSPCGYYCDDVYDDHAIFFKDGKSWSVPYTYANGKAQLTGEPSQVTRTWVPVDQAAGATKPQAPGVGKRGLPMFKAKGDVTLPPDHKAVVQVPKGGSSCSTCAWLGDDGASCMNKYMAAYMGAQVPAPLPYAADETCSDWWEPAEGVLKRDVLQAAQAAFDHYLRIGKAEPQGDQRYVLGIVLEPDVVDAQNDTYSASEVRNAAEKFMESYRNVGLMHKQMVTGKVEIIESYIAPVDMTIGETPVKKGTWLMAVRVKDDGLWGDVKAGRLGGFSIGGSAIRRPAAEGV